MSILPMAIFVYMATQHLERGAVVIGFHVNAHKLEYMCFNQRGGRSTQNGSYFKISRQVHLPRKQCLINQDWYQHVTSKGSYR